MSSTVFRLQYYRIYMRGGTPCHVRTVKNFLNGLCTRAAALTCCINEYISSPLCGVSAPSILSNNMLGACVRLGHAAKRRTNTCALPIRVIIVTHLLGSLAHPADHALIPTHLGRGSIILLNCTAAKILFYHVSTLGWDLGDTDTVCSRLFICKFFSLDPYLSYPFSPCTHCRLICWYLNFISFAFIFVTHLAWSPPEIFRFIT